MRCLFGAVCVFVVGLAEPLHAQTPAEDQALADAIKALTGQVETALKDKKVGEGSRTALQNLEAVAARAQALDATARATRSLANLVGALGEMKAPDVTAQVKTVIAGITAKADTTSVQFLLDRTEEFVGLMGRPGLGVFTDAKLRDQLLILVRDLPKRSRVPWPQETVTAVLDAVTSVANDDKAASYSLPIGNGVVLAGLTGIASTADARMRVITPVEHYLRLTNEIIALLPAKTAAEVKESDRIRALILQNKDALEKTVAVKAAIEPIAAQYRPMIHIIEAYFGDVRMMATSQSRRCDATIALRSTCERKVECNLDAAYATGLCGYDPVPFAPDQHRGVAVLFSCHTGGDALWDRLAENPTVDPDPAPGSVSDLSDPGNLAQRGAILRGTAMKLRCPFPPGLPSVN